MLRCAEQGKISLLSRKGVRELQCLIFHLAVFHVITCVLTFSLGMAKGKTNILFVSRLSVRSINSEHS